MEYHGIRENELVAALRAGDEKAYKLLYECHYRVLCAFAYGYVNDSFVAETLVSDVIYAIWENKENFFISQSLRAYLMRAVKNRCINHLTYRMRQDGLKQKLGEHLSRQQQSFHEQPDYPLCALLEKELEEKITVSVNAMPELTREIFLLSRNEKLKYDEIARIKNLTVDVVKYHIHLSLSKLRDDLSDYLLFFVFILLFS